MKGRRSRNPSISTRHNQETKAFYRFITKVQNEVSRIHEITVLRGIIKILVRKNILFSSPSK